MQLHLRIAIAAAVGAAGLASAAVDADAATVTVEQKGQQAYLADGEGRTLYVFSADPPGGDGRKAQSNCYEICAEAWPPFYSDGKPEADPEADASLVDVIERKDGRMQVTYDGHPLYYFTRDVVAEKPVDNDREAYGGNWSLLAPSGESVSGKQAAANQKDVGQKSPRGRSDKFQAQVEAPARDPASDRQRAPEIVVLDNWNTDEVYRTGWSLDQLINQAEVQGVDGEAIGDIENVIFDEQNRITALIAEVGGFWDIGDTHVAVPWSQVRVSQDRESVRTPIDEDNVEDFPIYGDAMLFTKDAAKNRQVVNSDLYTGPRLWKATEVIGDYALLSDYTGYGYVTDLIIGDDDRVQAIVISTGYGTGPFAYPYRGYRDQIRPGDPYYQLPYDAADIEDQEPFDYSRLWEKQQQEQQETTGSIQKQKGEQTKSAPGSRTSR